MRKFIPIILIIILAAAPFARGQDSLETVDREAIYHLMALLNLAPADLSFRQDYTKLDKHRLATVAKLMNNPYGMVEFTDTMAEICKNGEVRTILEFAYKHADLGEITDRERTCQGGAQNDGGLINTFYNSPDLNSFLGRMHDHLEYGFPECRKEMLKMLTPDEQKFLVHEFREVVVEDTADEFKTAEMLDSIQKAEEKYVQHFTQFSDKINKEPLLYSGYYRASAILKQIQTLQELIASGSMNVDSILADTVYLPKVTGADTYLGKQPGWRIGGTGDDYYKGDYKFVLDFGGDDRYDLSYDPDHPHDVIIIDLSGDDFYNAKTDFTIGSGCLGVGLLFDMDGNDTYNGKSFSCGSGFFGLGLLYDAAGHDRYNGLTHSQGAASFGIGAIIDKGGSDIYSSAIFSQGFGFVEGFGTIVDILGNDNYIAGNRYKDILRYDDHYLSLSQGFGYGIRPGLSGGIGTIVDYAGNDNYISDIFGQGASYWWALGVICDKSGNDQYISYQYAQGSGTHMSLGYLQDDSGDDFYRGKGLMQGVGHDYSCGFIDDRKGNDIYQADDLSQGAGSANGIGILIDSEGDDSYYVQKRTNTQGYGNPRRDFGSIGLFLDLAGTDKYWGNGDDNSIWKTDSKWGGGIDWEYKEMEDTVSVK